MKSRFCFHKSVGAALALICMVSTPLAADEILNNPDFSKGTDNWSGDLSDSNDNPLQSSTPGATLTFHDRHPVRIFQTFSADSDTVTCNIEFNLASGSTYSGSGKVSEIASDIKMEVSTNRNPGSNVVTTFRPPGYEIYNSTFNTPVIIVTNSDDNSISLYPLVTAVQAQTNAGQVVPITATNGKGSFTRSFKVKPHHGYRLYLAFPPGTGSVTVTKISLANASASANANDVK